MTMTIAVQNGENSLSILRAVFQVYNSLQQETCTQEGTFLQTVEHVEMIHTILSVDLIQYNANQMKL
jgi:hypothetical protein